MRKFSERMGRVSSSVIRDTMKYMSEPGILSLSAGSPASIGLPSEEIRDILDKLLAEKPVELLQYGITIGYNPLRKAVIEHLLKPKGIEAELNNTIIFTGSQQGIYLIFDVFIDPGDVVLVENPTFLAALNILRKMGANIVGVEMDDNGIIVEDLEEKVKKYNPKLLYTIPTFQNPTGRTIPDDRRREIARLASEYDFIVLEDDPYGEVRVSGEPVSPIKKYDTTGNVILLNSFSKLIAPGLRVAVATADPEIIDQLESVKQGADTHTPILTQALCAEYLNRGLMPGHLKETIEIYRARLDAMLYGLKNYFPNDCQYTVPEGGFFMWLKLPRVKNTIAILENAIKNYKVLYVPGAPFFVNPDDGLDCLRLNFSYSDPETIDLAMQRLGALLEEESNR